MTLLAAILLAAAPAKTPAKTPAKKVLQLEEMTVEGRIPKPQAFFILPRGALNLETLEKKESFLDRIKKSCERDPF